jgi:hypothetical protein
MEFTPNTIPAWLLGIIIIYTGLAWLYPTGNLPNSFKRIFSSAFLIWGTVFGIVFQLFPLDLDTRGFISRVMILMICLAQSIPLTVFFIRRAVYDRNKDKLQ